MASVSDGPLMFETNQIIIEEVMTKVEGLDSQEKKELSNLLTKYIDIFAQNSSDFGRTGKITGIALILAVRHQLLTCPESTPSKKGSDTETPR